MTTAPTMSPMISAVTNERFICKLLSIFLSRRKRIVRLHHQIAQEFVGRVDRGRPQDKTILPAVFADQAQPELVVLEEVSTKLRHGHALGLRSFRQALQGGVVEGKSEPVFARKIFRKGPRAL